MRRYAVAVAVALLLVPGCTVGVRRTQPSPSATTPTASVSPPACRTTYLPPDPKRPVIALTFAVDDAHAVVTGTEHVVFTPDLPVTELVFRLWLNGPGPADNDGRIDVTHASLPMRTEAAGAPTGLPGTLLRLTLPKPVPAGQRVTADLAYTITLPTSDVDRWGHTGRTAWWASAHPLLAWVHGSGWATDAAVGLLGETAVSETADYDVTVIAPAADTVVGNAFTDSPKPAAGGRRTWHFRNPEARDVAVMAGPFEVRHTKIGGVPVVMAVSAELATGSDTERTFGPVVVDTNDAMRLFQTTFGPFPFPTLTIVALPAIRGAGVEYPGLVMIGTRNYDVVLPHEVAHQWFYGLVGDNQAADPWLDEAFATYAEALVDPDNASRYLDAIGQQGAVGQPMAYWDKHPRTYSNVVYGKGAGALLAARDANPPLFDALLRCYVREHAYRVVTPADLAAALAPMPRAVEVLRDAGALPE